jgi:hypothetical protein
MKTIESRGHEHELEPQYGLPERLPADERILWQGAPRFATLAREAFHWRKLALYFAALLALRATAAISDGASPGQAVAALNWLSFAALTALACVAVLAWLTCRTTVYTLTDKRIVMRIGIVLTVAYNLPLRRIAAADLRLGRDATGNIALRLAGEDRIAWLHLWPHARPWRFARPEPMLRAVPDAAAVCALLKQAWSAANGQPAVAAATAVDAAPAYWPAQPSAT